jgi:hypothetical protein
MDNAVPVDELLGIGDAPLQNPCIVDAFRPMFIVTTVIAFFLFFVLAQEPPPPPPPPPPPLFSRLWLFAF